MLIPCRGCRVRQLLYCCRMYRIGNLNGINRIGPPNVSICHNSIGKPLFFLSALSPSNIERKQIKLLTRRRRRRRLRCLSIVVSCELGVNEEIPGRRQEALRQFKFIYFQLRASSALHRTKCFHFQNEIKSFESSQECKIPFHFSRLRFARAPIWQCCTCYCIRFAYTFA